MTGIHCWTQLDFLCFYRLR